MRLRADHRENKPLVLGFRHRSGRFFKALRDVGGGFFGRAKKNSRRKWLEAPDRPGSNWPIQKTCTGSADRRKKVIDRKQVCMFSSMVNVNIPKTL